MNILDLNNKHHQWHPKSHERSCPSDLHLTARNLLHEVYPTHQILEEVSIPLLPGETQYLDFYMPLKKFAIEVQGEQHYKFIAHFHHTRDAFHQSKARDNKKMFWCKLNGIWLIELVFNEKDKWKKLLEEPFVYEDNSDGDSSDS